MFNSEIPTIRNAIDKIKLEEYNSISEEIDLPEANIKILIDIKRADFKWQIERKTLLNTYKWYRHRQYNIIESFVSAIKIKKII